jgi:hypothetical protein
MLQPVALGSVAYVVFLTVGSIMHSPAVSEGAPAQVPSPTQTPTVPVPPPEDPKRLALEEKLKDLQRRENQTQDPALKQRLLRNIIDLCIELGRDYSPYQARMDAINEQLGEAGAAARAEEARQQENKRLQNRAVDALARGDIVAAGLALETAAKLCPQDPQTLRLAQRVEAAKRARWIRWGALGSLLSAAGLLALYGLLKGVRRGGRSRQLEIIEGPQMGEVFKLEHETTSLGALAAEADVVLTDPYRKISRRHCEITRNGRHYFLLDCSTNGTSVNGHPVPRGEPVLLRKGDTITLADDVVLRFG